MDIGGTCHQLQPGGSVGYLKGFAVGLFIAIALYGLGLLIVGALT